MIETLADANILTMLDIKVIHAIKQTQILKLCSGQAKANAKAKKIFDLCSFLL